MNNNGDGNKSSYNKNGFDKLKKKTKKQLTGKCFANHKTLLFFLKKKHRNSIK